MTKSKKKPGQRGKLKSGDNLLWLDLEMTGLDPSRCTILEIGVIVTDSRLKVLSEGPGIAIHHSDKVLSAMEPWSQHHHRKTGLTEECRVSTVSRKEAESRVLDFVKHHFAPNTARLCGNSIWQDRRFLSKYMPKLESYLHYRMIDVSTLKELVGRWYPKARFQPISKINAHRVLGDIRESIAELAFYRDKVFL
jgi:oligoribonuclease